MTRRSPVSSTVRSALPSLAALLSAGTLAGCQRPECQATRSEELATHGNQGARDLSHGELSGGFRELGVALGLVSHPRIAVAGAAPPVTHIPPPPTADPTPVPPTTPIPPPDPQPTGGGAVARVTTQPVAPRVARVHRQP